jgi:Cu-Zn family superoxide dismutase
MAASSAVCQAVCAIVSETGANNVLGYVTLRQSDVNSEVHITGSLLLSAGVKHGFSVCVYGDVSQGAASCGPIFNPFGKTHGAPGDAERMLGDLGNLVADENGQCKIDIRDDQVQLLGPHSVLGRSLVIYAGEDDQGRGGHENSLVNGNPGPRIACGVIGLSSN